MKKNIMVIGMLVALLIVPNFSIAQEEVSNDTTLAAVDTTIVAPKKEKKVREPREPRVQVIDSTHYSYGSVLTAHFGFGMSGLWATEGAAQLQNSWGFPGFNFGLRYSYFFRSWLGFTTGLEYSTYTSSISMRGVMDWKSGVINNLGEEYIHRLDFTEGSKYGSTWTEYEDLGMLEVPIALTFRYKPNKVGFQSTLGLKLGFPVKERFSYKGTLNHIGYSKMLDYAECGDQHFIANDSYDKLYQDYQKNLWSVINAEVFGEIGMLIQLHERIDLSLSVYGSYCTNDINSTPHAERQALGFRTAEQAARAPEMKVTCMNVYNGMIGTNAIDHINPWNCGIKIGLHFYCAGENDAERAARLAAKNIAPAPQIVYIRDTVREVTRDTVKMTQVIRDTVTNKVIVHDTITNKVIVHDTIVNQIEKVTQMLQKVIIYYRSGDSKTPIINPTNLLDDAAAIIAANPAIRVTVEGHASSDGNPQFNQMLSENRAMNVARVLREKGVRDSQIEIKAYGSSHPLKFGNANDPNKDRRVEIIPIAQ